MSSGFGRWHEGERFDVRLGDVQWLSEDRGVNIVEILDKRTNTIHRRRGDVRIIGNFSPIWVRWKGQKIEVEKLLWVSE